MVLHIKRIHSPSSINVYKQCPRKYYYQYIKRLPTSKTIHLIRGNIAHSVLEDIYTIDTSSLTESNLREIINQRCVEFLGQHWKMNKEGLSNLKLPMEKMNFYYQETLSMIESFSKRLSAQLLNISRKKKISLQEAFEMFKPEMESEFKNTQKGIRGFIDAIHTINGKIIILDYKTSKKDDITPDYKLQLAIYALLYESMRGKMPDKVGLYFLKFGTKLLDVNRELINLAEREVELIHINTQSEDIADYPQNITPLCKWQNCRGSGQCDFYGECIGKYRGR